MSITVPTLPDLAPFRGRNYFTDQEYTRAELCGLLARALAEGALPSTAPYSLPRRAQSGDDLRATNLRALGSALRPV